MTVPAQVDVTAVRAAQRSSSLLRQMAQALGELAARYPDVSDEVIRQQALEVLCVAQGNRVNVDLVARLVEARVLALM